MENKKIKNGIKYIFVTLLVSFTVLYFSMSAGYFEHTNGKKVALTNEQIEKFEKDIESGKNVDALNYVIQKENYENNVSKVGLTVSNITYKVVNKGISYGFKALEKLTESS